MVQQLTTLLGRFNQGNPVATSSHLLVLGDRLSETHALSALQLLQAERFSQTDQSLLRNGIVRARYKVERLTALFGESKKRGVGLLTLSPGDSAVSRFVKVRGSSRQADPENNIRHAAHIPFFLRASHVLEIPNQKKPLSNSHPTVSSISTIHLFAQLPAPSTTRSLTRRSTAPHASPLKAIWKRHSSLGAAFEKAHLGAQTRGIRSCCKPSLWFGRSYCYSGLPCCLQPPPRLNIELHFAEP